MDNDSAPAFSGNDDQQDSRVRYTDHHRQQMLKHYEGGQYVADPEVLALGVEGALNLLPKIDGALELLALYHLYKALSPQRGLSLSPILRPLFDDEDLDSIDWALDDAGLSIIGLWTPTEKGLAVLDLLIPESTPHTYTTHSLFASNDEKDEMAQALGMRLQKLYSLASRVGTTKDLNI